MVKKLKQEPVFWASIILVFAQVLTLYTTFREKDFIEANLIVSPDVSPGPTLAYFFIVVVLLGVILFLIPASKLKIVFCVMIADTRNDCFQIFGIVGILAVFHQITDQIAQYPSEILMPRIR